MAYFDYGNRKAEPGVPLEGGETFPTLEENPVYLIDFQLLFLISDGTQWLGREKDLSVLIGAMGNHNVNASRIKRAMSFMTMGLMASRFAPTAAAHSGVI